MLYIIVSQFYVIAQLEEVKAEEPKKLGPIAKLKELSEDKEEQMEIFSTLLSLEF